MRGWRAVLLESAIVLAAGLVLALLANGVSPRGLSLSRDYFGRGSESTAQAEPNLSANRPAGVEEEGAGLAERLRAKGLSLIATKEAEALFRDPQYEQELIVFVDARDDHHYQEGHIPGAYQFDRYYPENYLPAVLPACLSANKVVVYCTGGKCEDSEFAAVALKDAGVPAERISVYAGGITEWLATKLVVERGGRKSGITAAQPQ